MLLIGGLFGAAAVFAGESPDAASTPAPSASQAAPACAHRGPDEQGRMRVSAADRCPVCAMQPAKYPEFSCAIVLMDGCTYYFCSSGCMLHAWLEPERFLHAPPARLKQCIVRNYFSGEPLDGAMAWWIAGSDVIGPMGPAPLPVATEDELAAFKRRHGGNHVFRLPQLDLRTWRTLSGQMPPP
jgi:copper chaperone NosL